MWQKMWAQLRYQTKEEYPGKQPYSKSYYDIKFLVKKKDYFCHFKILTYGGC